MTIWIEKKLFAVYLGGKADGCNIELHDVVFVVGTSIGETYPLLAKKWFGNLQGFHIDSYMALENIDGYKIEVGEDPPSEKSLKKLYFKDLCGTLPFIEYRLINDQQSQNGAFLECFMVGSADLKVAKSTF